MKLNSFLPKIDLLKLILPRKKAKNSAARRIPLRSKTVKVLILGLQDVGKTSLVSKLCGRDMRESFERTLYDVHETEIVVDDCTVKFQFMDFAAPYVFPAMLDVFIQQADMFMLVYSADNAASFEELTKLRNQITLVKNRNTTELPMVVVNNKVDVKNQRLTRKSYQRRKSVSNWCSQCVDVSAKTGYNVNAVMETLIKESKFIGNKDELTGEPSVSGTYIYGGDDVDVADVGSQDTEFSASGKRRPRKKTKRSVSVQYHRGSSLIRRRVSASALERRRSSAGAGSPLRLHLKDQRSRSFDFSLLKRFSRIERDRPTSSHSSPTTAYSASAPASSSTTPLNISRSSSFSRLHSRSPLKADETNSARKSSGLLSTESAHGSRAHLDLAEGNMRVAASAPNTPGLVRRGIESQVSEDIPRTHSLQVRKGGSSSEQPIKGRCRSMGALLLSNGLLPGSDWSSKIPKPRASCSSMNWSENAGSDHGELPDGSETIESTVCFRAEQCNEAVAVNEKRLFARRHAVINAPSPGMIERALVKSPAVDSEDCPVSPPADYVVDSDCVFRPVSGSSSVESLSADSDTRRSHNPSPSAFRETAPTDFEGKRMRGASSSSSRLAVPMDSEVANASQSAPASRGLVLTSFNPRTGRHRSLSSIREDGFEKESASSNAPSNPKCKVLRKGGRSSLDNSPPLQLSEVHASSPFHRQTNFDLGL